MLTIRIDATSGIWVRRLSFPSYALRQAQDVPGSIHVIPVTDSVCRYLSSNIRLPLGTSSQTSLRARLKTSR